MGVPLGTLNHTSLKTMPNWGVTILKEPPDRYLIVLFHSAGI